MNKLNFKNYLALFMVVSMLFCQVAFAGDIDTTADFKDNKDAEFLIKLGIISESKIDDISMDATVTRGIMAQYVTRLLNIKGEKNSNTGFYDVPLDYYANSAINTVSGLKIMMGRGNNKFCPEEFVTYGDALAILVRTLGYGDLANYRKGEYPYNYYSVANELGLLKGMKFDIGKNIKKRDLITLMRRTLDTEAYQLISFSGDNARWESTKGETLLYLSYRIDRVESQVTANDVTYLNSISSMADGMVLISNFALKVGNTDIDKKLGYNVSAYFDIDDEEVIYYEDRDTKTFTIDSEDIISYENSKLKYQKNSNEFEFDVPKNLYIIYNNKAVNEFKKEMMMPKDGKLTFVDGDKDSKYDVLFIEDYKSYVVDRVLSDPELIVFEKNKSLKAKEEGKDIFVYDEEGKQIDYKSLAKGDVVSVLESKDKKYVTICVSRKLLQGKIETAEDVDGRKYYDIKTEDETKRIASVNGFSETYKDAKIGAEGKIYIDKYGKIAGFSKNDSEGEYIGYLVNGKKLTVPDIDVTLKIFNEKGEMTELKLKDKTEIDGDRLSKETVYDKLADSTGSIKSQLIKYMVNKDGIIDKIDTSINGTKESKDTLTKVLDTGSATGTYYVEPKLFVYGKVNVHTSSNPLMFSLPEGDVKKANNKDFNIITGNMLTNGDSYKFSAYKLNADEIGASIIVTSSPDTATYGKYEIVSAISKITEVVKDDGEPAYKVTYFYMQHEKTALTEDKEVFEGRHVGDMLMLHFNNKEEIDAYTPYFNGDTKTMVSTENPSKENVNTQRRTIYGGVYKIYDDLLVLCTDDKKLEKIDNYLEEPTCESHRKPKYSVYLFDTNKNKVRVAAWNEIVDYVTDKNEYSKVFMFSNYANDTDAMIVK